MNGELSIAMFDYQKVWVDCKAQIRPLCTNLAAHPLLAPEVSIATTRRLLPQRHGAKTAISPNSCWQQHSYHSFPSSGEATERDNVLFSSAASGRTLH